MKIKKGDTVTILRGKDAGRSGKVLRAIPKKNQVIVEGINIVKKHVKRQGEEQPGGIVEIEKPLDVSKVVKKEVKKVTTKKKNTKKPAAKKTTKKESSKKTK